MFPHRAPVFAASLLLVLAACSSKPASNTAADQPASSDNSRGAMSNAMQEPSKPVVESVVVPAGTTLTVRLGQALGSKISSPGESFTATLAAPVEVDGKTVIPSGATARGRCRFEAVGPLKAEQCCRSLNSVTVNGTEHPTRPPQ
jgi:hypothetical protein